MKLSLRYLQQVRERKMVSKLPRKSLANDVNVELLTKAILFELDDVVGALQ